MRFIAVRIDGDAVPHRLRRWELREAGHLKLKRVQVYVCDGHVRRALRHQVRDCHSACALFDVGDGADLVKAERDRTGQGSGVGSGLHLTPSGHQQTEIDGHRTEPAKHGHRERYLNENRAALPGAECPAMQLQRRHS